MTLVFALAFSSCGGTPRTLSVPPPYATIPKPAPITIHDLLEISVSTVSSELCSALKIDAGVYVKAFPPDGFAESMGILRGDIITAINDTPVSDSDLFNWVLQGKKAGEEVWFTLYGGETVKLSMAPAPPVNDSLKVGDRGPGGGYIFYDKESYSDGWRYLEAAPERTEFVSNWGDAVQRCKRMVINGIVGWYLPSKDELTFMYWYLKVNDLGGFQDEVYWSSSQSSKFGAWGQDFSNGDQGSNGNDTLYWVRPVRAF
jgi:hypothetical protein